MAGPCSLPEGNRALWLQHNEQICSVHSVIRDGNIIHNDDKRECAYVTLRVYLNDRGRLVTGKTK